MAGKRKKSESAKADSKTAKTDKSENELIAQFEKHIYDLQQMLEVCRSFCSTIEFSSLIESILYVAMAQMRVTGAGLFVQKSFSDYYVLSENYSGITVDPAMNYKIQQNSPLVAFMESVLDVFTLPELEKQLPGCADLEIIASLNPSLIVPLMLKNRVNGILIMGERIALDGVSQEYTSYERDEIKTIASLASVAVHNSSLIDQSSTDMMTKLRLKFYFYNMLENKLDAAFAEKQPLSVIMFDIDFFKKFNDTYGHACGDHVLKKTADVISESIREGDMASRYGGEEFTVMLCNTGKEEARIVAERIRMRIAANSLWYEGNRIHVTISAGVSVFSVDENPVRSAKTLVDQADKALYVSKRNGRNQVTVLGEEKKQESDEESGEVEFTPV